MARLLKCYGTCGDKYEKELLKEYKHKNYCSECYHKIVTEYEERDKLYKYMAEFFDIDFAEPRLKKQAKDYKNDYGVTYDDIAYAMYYGKTFTDWVKPNIKFGIGFVPHVLGESMRYRKDQDRRKIEGKNIRHEVEKKKVKTTFKKKDKKRKLINMEDLF